MEELHTGINQFESQTSNGTYPRENNSANKRNSKKKSDEKINIYRCFRILNGPICLEIKKVLQLSLLLKKSAKQCTITEKS